MSEKLYARFVKEEMIMRKIRVLISKIGLDGHDVGAKIVSTLLRDAGMEVIYLGRFQTPEMIVKAAIEENVDVIGLSCQSPNHVRLIPKMIDLLKKKGLENTVVVVGGTIPEPFLQELKDAGVDEIFGSGTMSSKIVSSLTALVAQKGKSVDAKGMIGN
jgi:methylmalonyl-CoA mutase, C-terminal domain